VSSKETDTAGMRIQPCPGVDVVEGLEVAIGSGLNGAALARYGEMMKKTRMISQNKEERNYSVVHHKLQRLLQRMEWTRRRVRWAVS
jgi:hypothetical protein